MSGISTAATDQDPTARSADRAASPPRPGLGSAGGARGLAPRLPDDGDDPDEPPVRDPLPRGVLRAALLTIDALIFALAFLAATAIRLPGDPFEFEFLGARLGSVVGLMLLGLALHDAYDVDRVRNGQELLRRLAFGSVVGIGLIALFSYMVPHLFVGRGLILFHAIVAFPVLLGWRRFAFRVVRETALRPRALVLGEAGPAARVARALEDAPYAGAEVLGVLVPRSRVTPPPPGPPGPAAAAPPNPQAAAALPAMAAASSAPLAPAVASTGSAPAADASSAGLRAGEPAPPDAQDPGAVIGTYQDLRALVDGLEISQLFVVAGAHDRDLPLTDLVDLGARGLEIEDGTEAFEALTGKILVEKLTPGWLVFANAFERTPLQRARRRVFETAVAIVLIALLAPVMLLVALLVRLTSPGPVLFRQIRTGERGRPFELLKFRTMREDAEAKSGPVWAQARDPRVTSIGGILRSTRLDELPQLWNVVRGDMYFVGPRPERPEFVAMLSERIPCFEMRHSVKPGITGWAQINYRYGASVEDAIEKLHYDLYYIQNMSLLLDIDIVLGTLRVVFGAANKH